MERFKVGDEVCWSSPYGDRETKNGRVVAVIPANKDVTEYLAKFCKTHKFMIGYGKPRDHVSYLVEVSVPNCKQKLLYCPKVIHIYRRLFF